MSDPCRNDCIGPPLFPERPSNRPGLSHVHYRIGTYTDFRAALLRALDRDPVLAHWTHRDADDPGIALLEGASVLGDILSFYQELYANEAYLRTAQWRESVADLVRLLGYRLSPGVGGKATFAFEVKGKDPVTIPKGFSVRAQLKGMEKSAGFQSVTEVTAHPHLSKFHLYRQRREKPLIRKDSHRLEVESLRLAETGEEREARDIASIRSLKLQPGDRMILIPSGEILIISSVQQVLDRTVIEFEGSLTANRGRTVSAFRIGRTFRHFGHNAPAVFTRLDRSTPAELLHDDTEFLREFGREHERYSTLSAWEMPLDEAVDDLAMGNAFVCQGAMLLEVGGTGLSGERVVAMHAPFTAVRSIEGLRADALRWGNLTGPSTVVTLDQPLSRSLELGDVRRFRFHEVKGPEMLLRAPTEWEDGTVTGRTFNYWGTYAEALALAGRRVILCKDSLAAQPVKVTSTPASFVEALGGKDAINPWLWPVSLDTAPENFQLEDFAEEKPKVTGYGNLVDTTQGRTEKEAVLGNGDSRETLQTFKLPKSPLTYFRSEDETPPEVPELEIYVNDRLWKRVPSFFDQGPMEQVYIVREDADGDSWVQFGDGKSGARLPSGSQNVVARYRTGIGAHGPLEEGVTVQAGARLDRLHKIQLPGLVAGGNAPENGDNAREAAPGKVQSLGRLVSLQDFASETLAIPGVSKVAARWGLWDNVPAILLTVLMKGGREKEEEEVQKILSKANRDRGAQRFPIIVRPGVRQYVYLTLTAGRDPAFRSGLVQKSIREALGVMGDERNGIDGTKGLFGDQQRNFGQPEYTTRIEGTVQNIAGVVWARVNALGFLVGHADDPLALTIPQEPGRSPVVLCHPDRSEESDQVLLGLHTAHLHLTLPEVDSTEVPQDG